MRTFGSELSCSTPALLRGQLRAALLHEVRQAQRMALAKSRQVAGQVHACKHNWCHLSSQETGLNPFHTGSIITRWCVAILTKKKYAPDDVTLLP